MEQVNERWPNNTWGWVKIVGNVVASGAIGFGTGGPIGAGAAIFLNLWGLFQHTPANTMLTPGELRVRAVVQAEKQVG